MNQSPVYPYLEIEQETFFKKEIEDLFDLVKQFDLSYKAKQIIYPLRQQYQGLEIGGGANHIWFHHLENGQISPKRVAIIYFDPYYGMV